MLVCFLCLWDGNNLSSCLRLFWLGEIYMKITDLDFPKVEVVFTIDEYIKLIRFAINSPKIDLDTCKKLVENQEILNAYLQRIENHMKKEV